MSFRPGFVGEIEFDGFDEIEGATEGICVGSLLILGTRVGCDDGSPKGARLNDGSSLSWVEGLVEGMADGCEVMDGISLG